MMGTPDQRVQGLFNLASHDLMEIQQRDFPHLILVVSFYEIYCGKLFDLLN